MKAQNLSLFFFLLFSFSESGAPLTIISSSSFAPLDFQKRWRHFSCWIFELFNTRKNSNLGMVSERREISWTTTRQFNFSTIQLFSGRWLGKGKTLNLNTISRTRSPRKHFLEILKTQLGVFLPTKKIDDNEISICNSMWICRIRTARERIVACSKFYGKSRFDTVQISNKEEWFAKIHVFFRCSVNGKAMELALVQWFDLDPQNCDRTGMRRLLAINHFQILPIDRIVGEVPVIESRRGAEGVRFHLDHNVLYYRQRNWRRKRRRKN